VTDSQQMQLPLFDNLPASEPHPAPTHKKRKHSTEGGTPLELFSIEEPTPPPIDYPAPDQIVPTILEARSLDLLEALAALVSAAGDAPGIAAELVEVVRDTGLAGLIGGYSKEQRAAAAVMIGLLRQPVDVEPLVQGMWDRSGRVRLALTQTLGELGTLPDLPPESLGQIVNGLIVALHHNQPEIRTASARALGYMRAAVAIPKLIERLSDEEDQEIREVVAVILGVFNTTEAIEAILEAYDYDRLPRQLSYDLLTAAGDTAVEPLLGAMRRWNIRVVSRALAADVLAHLRVQSAVEPLITIIERPHEHEVVRVAAARALAALGDPAAIRPLEMVYDEPGNPGPYVLRAVDDALASLKPQ
jgi:HEAT repeat protein